MITHGELAAAIGKLEGRDRRRQGCEIPSTIPCITIATTMTRTCPSALAQRAYPFLDMMRLAQQKDADIVWGV